MFGKNKLQRSFFFIAALTLASCGGGSGKGGGSVGSTPPTAPAITTQPANQSVTAPATATFSVVASGTAPLSYQWQMNNSNISGATSASYTTPATSSADDGETFDVVVTNSAGSATSNTATLSVSTTAMATPTDITTFHNDVARTGLNPTESMLTQSNVNMHTFGLLRNISVDGRVDAEPLYLSGLMVNGAAHNVVFVETENESVYAFDSDTGVILWQDTVANLLPPGETVSDARDCSQVMSVIGITATPVIDRHAGQHGTMFLVGMSKDSLGNYHQRLHALDVTTGAELLNGPTEIAATYPGTGLTNNNGVMTFAPGNYKERAALLLLNGQIYLTFASHCDIPPYQAWVMAYSESSLQQTTVLNLTPNGGDTGPGGQWGSGAIWQSGGGPAADPQGNIYIEVANGAFETTLDANGFPNQQDFGNAFVKLTPAGGKLTVADYFTMSGTLTEDDSDRDLGSGGPLVLPDMSNGSGTTKQLAIAAGKDGAIYVADRTNMGKFNSTTDNIYQELLHVIPGGIWGVPAYFNQTLYYCDSANSLKAFAFTNAKLSSAPTSSTSTNFEYPGALPSVSSNGTSNGIVWAIENTGVAVLRAYPANDLTTELYDSNQAAGSADHPGAGNKFITPAIADGKVFVATQMSVAVYGLLTTQR
jgi:hypothetical protein